ncbi:Chromosome partitioning ATPase, Mrp family, contains Fe-S cluster [Roseivivax sediminis]|uniref:Chromosome partitioning ATPase, Mrp family, contains Fe-S cluster n=2 Tax=Roseivivax sediminis TaxID=936889 RepID=A0A1I1UM01_9RHOB|nr:Chromosome partitioning ATPase, Mrp family, contains Fe-S cluster [Roseivivax sediminis]
MTNRPKFRRRRRTQPEQEPAEDDLRPIPPLDTRQERLARREAEAEAERQREEARQQAEEDARRQAQEDRLRAEEEARRQAEQDRQRAEAEAQRQAEAERLRVEAETRRRAEEVRLREETEARQQAEEDRQRARARADQVAHGDAGPDGADEQRTDRRPHIERAPVPASGRAVARAPAVEDDPGLIWDTMSSFPVDERELDRNRIITASRHDPAHASFDVLRTRLMQALSERQWSRVAVTSPTQGCGKTFTTANLGISLSRQSGLRTVVLDLDLRRPGLHEVFGLSNPGPLGAVLRGTTPPEAHLRRLGPNGFHAGRDIAFGFNDAPEPYAAELLQDSRTARALDTIEERLAPDVMLFDLPPALVSDDVLALRPCFDAVLLVVGGGLTNQSEIRAVEQRLGENTPLLGVILNRAEGTNSRKYAY